MLTNLDKSMYKIIGQLCSKIPSEQCNEIMDAHENACTSCTSCMSVYLSPFNLKYCAESDEISGKKQDILMFFMKYDGER